MSPFRRLMDLLDMDWDDDRAGRRRRDRDDERDDRVDRWDDEDDHPGDDAPRRRRRDGLLD